MGSAALFGSSSSASLQSDSLFHLIVEACPDIVYLYDRLERKYLYVSGRCYDVLGYKPEYVRQLSSEDVERLIHPDDRAFTKEHYDKQERMLDSEVATTTYRVRDANGVYRPMRCRQKVFSRAPNGAVQYILGVATDLTDETRHKHEIAALREQIMHIRDDERRQMALRMHDRALQHLVAASLLLKRVETRLPVDGTSGSLAEARRSLSLALREMVDSMG